MSYDASYYDAFSGRPAYQIHLYVRRNAVSGNSSSYAWELLGEKVASGTTWTAYNYPWDVWVAGNHFTGMHSLDFRSTNSISLGSGTTGWVGHDSNGYLSFGVSAWYHTDGAEYFGNADLSGTFNADRIPQVPGAPYGVGITQITPVSFVYQFSGTTDGGAAIDSWQAQIATNSGYTTGVQTVSSGGTTTFSGLAPGTQYWARARGHNSVGWGAWSGSLTATTLSGAYVGNTSNPSFSPAAVYVGSGNAFVLAPVYVGSGGSFVIAG